MEHETTTTPLLRGFWAPVHPEHVAAAVAEYDQLGRDAFLARYGFGRAGSFLLVHDGRDYDSKAILGVAYGHATGTPLGPREFSGGTSGAAGVLRRLGFTVRQD